MHIIQDFIKIINNRISKYLLLYIFFIFSIISSFMLGSIHARRLDAKLNTNVVDWGGVSVDSFVLGEENNILTNDKASSSTNIESGAENSIENNSDVDNNQNSITDSKVYKSSINKSKIFGSRKGKYFYYEGCGGKNISKKNLVYYKSEKQAESTGKKLYSKCK